MRRVLEGFIALMSLNIPAVMALAVGVRGSEAV
jgi:hypothetical protein